VRRAPAVLLLFFLSIPLLTPLVSAESESKLPACCRRDGKHGCSMDKRSKAQGDGVASAKALCAQYPNAKAMPVSGAMDVPRAPMAVAFVLSGPVATAQAEARYRISFSRAWQKRGPPLC
jgi:hypothetical protein